MSSTRDVTLESGLALKQPVGKLEKQRRVMTGQRERRIHEGVRFNQSAVEIDTEGRKSSQSGFGDRSGQPNDLPRFEGFYVGTITGLFKLG